MLESKKESSSNSIQSFFRAMFNFMAANLPELSTSRKDSFTDITYTLLFALVGAGYVSFLWFWYSGRHLHKRSDEIRHGHEGATWVQLVQTEQKRVKWAITACLTIYLPLTRLAIEILAAAARGDVDFDNDKVTYAVSASALMKKRYRDSTWGFLVFLAVWLLLTFTIPLPILLWRAIKDNKPTGSLENPLKTYDLDGLKVSFDDKVYARLVAKDPAQLRCLYRSLYAGFGKKCSYYKVWQMLFKVALVLPLVAFPQPEPRSIITLFVYCVIFGVFWATKPFSNPIDLIMDINGKYAALVTCLGGAIIGFSVSAGTQTIVVTCVNIFNIVHFIFMAAILFLSVKPAQVDQELTGPPDVQRHDAWH